MKITRFQAENFKKLRVVEIIPGDGAVVPIRGRNAQGKSSVLDAIQAALGGKSVMPSKPVRSGEEAGAVRLELDDGAVVIRRTFDTEGGGQIIVESADGARYPSPQKLLDGLYTSVAFDPLAYTRAKPEDQYKLLRSLVKLAIDPEELKKKNKADYEERRDVNRDAKQAQLLLDQMPVFENVPAEKVDEQALEDVIGTAVATNSDIEARKLRRESAWGRLEVMDTDITACRTRIAQLEEDLSGQIDTREALNKQLNDAEVLPAPIDISEAQEKLRTARETNRQIEAAAKRKAQQLLLTNLDGKAERLTKSIEGRKDSIAKAFEAAAMPVPGLTFSDGVVLFHGEPFDQVSSAEKLRVSTAIGMASNPKLRVMLVRDGSLLDPEGEELLAAMALEHNFQFWVEAVDTSGKVGIVMEDGAVRSVDGEEAPEATPIEKKRKAKSSDDKPVAENPDPKSIDERPCEDSERPADGPINDAGSSAAPDVSIGDREPVARVAESLFD
ncbi:AAA family ATPase [Sphingomonas paeninsulae]|uniref:AAA family ATPase n=1 Tax=Sphingomonas paeninsulae TaxID=2319844 RepID=UPI0013CED5B8|nr:AAA family ATPase [Sphingomonas paeninsulae]